MRHLCPHQRKRLPTYIIIFYVWTDYKCMRYVYKPQRCNCPIGCSTSQLQNNQWIFLECVRFHTALLEQLGKLHGLLLSSDRPIGSLSRQNQNNKCSTHIRTCHHINTDRWAIQFLRIQWIWGQNKRLPISIGPPRCIPITLQPFGWTIVIQLPDLEACTTSINAW